MAKDLNKVQFTGYLGADPEMRCTEQGGAVTTFRVASNRQVGSREERREETEWFGVVAWDKLGEICNQYLTKGTRVYIEGRLQTRTWIDRDGQKRYTTEVVAQDMLILSAREEHGSLPDSDGLVEQHEELAKEPVHEELTAVEASHEEPAPVVASTSGAAKPRRRKTALASAADTSTYDGAA